MRRESSCIAIGIEVSGAISSCSGAVKGSTGIRVRLGEKVPADNSTAGSQSESSKSASFHPVGIAAPSRISIGGTGRAVPRTTSCLYGAGRPFHFASEITCDGRSFKRERTETEQEAGRGGPPPRSGQSVKTHQRSDRVATGAKIWREIELGPRQALGYRTSGTARDLDAVDEQHEARVGGHSRGDRCGNRSELNRSAQVAESIPGFFRGIAAGAICETGKGAGPDQIQRASQVIGHFDSAINPRYPERRGIAESRAAYSHFEVPRPLARQLDWFEYSLYVRRLAIVGHESAEYSTQ